MDISFNPAVLDRIKYEQGIRHDVELAKLLGVGPATLIRWRNGKSAPSYAAVFQMVIRFGIPFKDMAAKPPEKSRSAAA